MLKTPTHSVSAGLTLVALVAMGGCGGPPITSTPGDLGVDVAAVDGPSRDTTPIPQPDGPPADDGPECTAVPVRDACAGKCGQVADGCGAFYACDATNGGRSCGKEQKCDEQGECIVCVPRTCQEQGHSCGLATDGCGNQINCWPDGATSCPEPFFQTCIAAPGTGLQNCEGAVPPCEGPLCDAIPRTCTLATPTTLTGTVRTPGRDNNGTLVNDLAVPNALVYIPANPSIPLPAIFEGVQPGNPLSCGRCDDEVLVAEGTTVMAAAVTDAFGRFTLRPRIPAGVPFQLVVKAGKWRRVVEIASDVVSPCESRELSFEQSRLAAHSLDGAAGTQLPKMAVSTGRIDAIECVLRSVGIAEQEFSTNAGAGRIHMYRAAGTFVLNGNTVQRGGQQMPGGSVSDASLLGSEQSLNSYDIVVGDCQASPHTPTDNTRIRSYVDNGGRLFASHYSSGWLDNNGSLEDGSDWRGLEPKLIATLPGTLSLQPDRPRANPIKSEVFIDWLTFHGALDGTTPGQTDRPAEGHFTITDPRRTAGTGVGGSTDEWVIAEFSDGIYPQQLSFNTPYGLAEDEICGRVAFSSFHVVANNGNVSATTFPGACRNDAMTTQELTLAFQLFDLATCVSEGGGPPLCVPLTADEVCPEKVDACGFVPDGCGGVVDCGGCPEGYDCVGQQCLACQPVRCEEIGRVCGTVDDGCGERVNCGDCGPNQRCSSEGACVSGQG